MRATPGFSTAESYHAVRRLESIRMSRRDIRAHVGELLISGFDGLSLPDEMREIARAFDLGGVIIFSRNVEAPSQVAELALATEGLRQETPLWFSVDQEG